MKENFTYLSLKEREKKNLISVCSCYSNLIFVLNENNCEGKFLHIGIKIF